MNEEDFACDKFVPQKWRKDMCKNCYQTQRLHNKKQKQTTPVKNEASPLPSPTASPKSQAKVFQRFVAAREQAIDKNVPARDRTPPRQLEGIPEGAVRSVLGEAPRAKFSKPGVPKKPVWVAQQSPSPPQHRANLSQRDEVTSAAAPSLEPRLETQAIGRPSLNVPEQTNREPVSSPASTTIPPQDQSKPQDGEVSTASTKQLVPPINEQLTPVVANEASSEVAVTTGQAEIQTQEVQKIDIQKEDIAAVNSTGDAQQVPIPISTEETIQPPPIPEPTIPEPEPAIQEPEPAISEPEPTIQEPEPAIPEPEPTIQEPKPTIQEPVIPEPEPTIQEPVIPEPEPTIQEPEPAIPEPEPTIQEPKPTIQEPVIPEPEPTIQEPVIPEPEPTITEPVIPEPEPTITEPVIPEPEPTIQEPEPAIPEPEPAIQEPVPAIPEPEPTIQEPEPAISEPEPTIQEPKPTIQEPEPAISEPEPTIQEPEPTIQEPKPTIQEPEPAISEPEPTIQEPKPTIPEPEPTIQEPESAISEPEPAVQEPEPAVQEPEPTIPEPKPVIPEPEPAIQEPVQEPEPTIQEPEPVEAPTEESAAPKPDSLQVVSETTVTGEEVQKMAVETQPPAGDEDVPVPPPLPSDEVVSLGQEAAIEVEGDEVVSLGQEAAIEAEGDDVPVPPPLPLGVPPPPPPPPIGGQTYTRQRQVARPPPREVLARTQLLADIQGGISLRAVPPPTERPIGEEKVVDVASELRQKVLKRRKQETQSMTARFDEKREAIKKMEAALRNSQGTPTFLHLLKFLLEQADKFLDTIDIPADVLAQKTEWPSWLVDDLREVIQHMKVLEDKVVAAEKLCQQTLEGSSQPWRVNPQMVERCVQDVVRVAKELHSDESRYFKAAQSFPVDESDLQLFLHRAATAVTPLLDKLYEKAFQSHQSISDHSVTKYDLSFRIQNAQRLLRLCCNMSDALGMYLQVPKHAMYSEAQLKSRELTSQFQKTIKVTDRQGEWDTEESLQLQKPFTKRASQTEVREETQLLSRILEAIISGRNVDEPLTLVTEKQFSRIEVQLIKAAITSGNFEVIDSVVALRDKMCQDDEETRHRRDSDWLLEAVTKGNHECIKHLVQKHSLPINCQAGETGNSSLHRAAQRGDLQTMAYLIRLGAEPLLKNSSGRTPLHLFALKCFPPCHFRDGVEQKEPLFDLSSYVNNPSLSDVTLIADDGKRFHGHRLVLCVQSPVFKSMLDSDLWVESKNKEIPFPVMSSRVVQVLLQYLYTGRCLFTREDLNLGIELMEAADQYLLEPMKLQCERVLCKKIDAEVVVPLYYAAFRFTAKKLHANCCNFLLTSYNEVSDPGHEALLHLMENPPVQL